MAKASHTLQKGAVVQHTTKAHNLKGQLPEGSMESLAINNRFVTLNCRTLSSELQQAALSTLLRYLCVPFAALQETRMRDRPVISIENYTIYCGDADENKVGGCTWWRNLAQRRLDAPFYNCGIAEDVNSGS
ncbi:hypothetical protein RB195_018941 [Necator americanus]|uniref:Uncharacterized protein n=1 Tax=Necator americanus TaxID=51031 RepID=A0ABR1CBX5_NECAM